MNGSWMMESAFIRWNSWPKTRVQGHHRPRSTEGAHPGRVSTMRNTVTPMRSAMLCGKSSVSETEFLSGDGMLPEANAGCRKARGIHNPPDRSYGQPERALTGSGCLTRRTR